MIIRLALGLALSLSMCAKAGTYNQGNIAGYLKEIAARHTTDAQRRGLEIFTHQYLIDEGWIDTSAEMDMELIDAAGNKSRRRVVKQMFEDGSKPDKTIGIFLYPADVKGVVMLTHEQSYGADKQWLYLSSLRRTKKINAENKSGSFMGTEFAWEDISTTELTKYSYRYLRDEGDAWVVERVPNYEFSGYSKLITWVDKSNYQTVKVDFYDKKGDLLKTEKFEQWKQYEGRYWRPSLFHMVNHRNGKKTVLRMRNYVFGSGLPSGRFTSLGLKRISLSEFR